MLHDLHIKQIRKTEDRVMRSVTSGKPQRLSILWRVLNGCALPSFLFSLFLHLPTPSNFYHVVFIKKKKEIMQIYSNTLSHGAHMENACLSLACNISDLILVIKNDNKKMM